MNINKTQGNPAFLDVCRCSKEPQKYVVLSLSRLKHGFDCSAALQVSPRIAPLFICPAAIVPRPRSSVPTLPEILALQARSPHRDPRSGFVLSGIPSSARSHAGQRTHESQHLDRAPRRTPYPLMVAVSP